MKITLPERLAGTRDALFVLEVEFPVATAERTIEVGTTGAIEALDLRGTGPGGTYEVPVGVERLHVPMRVTDNAEGEASVIVKLTKGPESPKHEERTLLLEKGPAAAAASGAGGKLAVAAVLVALLGGAAFWLGPKLLGGDKVPDVAGQAEMAATEALQKAEYVVEVVVDQVDAADQDGVVLRTIPAGGSKLAKGERVQLVVGSSASPMEKVDAVVGQTAAAAAAALKAAGFQVLEHYVDARPGQTPGRVVRQSPGRATMVARGTEVEIWIARKAIEPTPPPVEPPTPPVEPPTPPVEPPTPPVEPPTPPVEPPTPPVEPPTPPVEPPTPPVEPPTPPVEPPTPPVEPPSNLVDVPALVGMSLADAEKKLERVGLFAIPEFETTPDASKDKQVLRQVPEPGSGGAPPGTQVFLTVGRFKAAPPPVEPPTPPVEPPTPPVEPPTPPVEPPTPPVEPPTPPVEPPTPPVEPPTPPVEPPTPPVEPPTPPVEPPTPPVEPRPVRAGQVPDLIGLTRERATGLVRSAGFRFRVHLEETGDVPDGQVLSQKPGPGQALAAGGTVDVIVARQPATRGLVVPDVVGKPRDEAERILRAQSFLVRTTWGGGGTVGTVTGQEPGAGVEAPRRSWVEIVISQGRGAARSPTGGPPPALPTDGGAAPAGPGDSGSITRPPAVGEGPVVVPPPTPRGVEPVPPVQLPSRDAPANIAVPDLAGKAVRAAIEEVLAAGLIPIVEVDRSGDAAPGTVARQSHKGAKARPGDLVRVGVRVASSGYERFTDVPPALGGLVGGARSRFMAGGSVVEIVEVSAPGHPYAGTGRVAAQYPVGSVPRSAAQRITFWIIRR